MDQEHDFDEQPGRGNGPRRPSVNPWTVPALMVIVALGLVLGYNYFVWQMKREFVAVAERRLPLLSRLEDNLVATNSQGETVELQELKGKVLVASYVFTRCPSGCSGIQADMAAIREEFGEDADRMHFLSFSLDPEHDTPEVLAEFRKLHQLEGDNWWFITGDPKALRLYMTHQFQFIAPTLKPEEERAHPDDLFNHDMRVAIVDHKAHVRGYYSVMHAQDAALFREYLRTDIGRLLDEAKGVGGSSAVAE